MKSLIALIAIILSNNLYASLLDDTNLPPTNATPPVIEPIEYNSPPTLMETVNSTGWPDSLWVSPDGGMILFMYSRYNFMDTILTGAFPEIDEMAPTPLGHHKNDNNPWNDSDLYMAIRLPDGSYSDLINLSFNTYDAECCAMLSGNDIYYQKGGDIYTVSYLNGSWGDPSAINAVNTGYVETNPHYDAVTNTLYFATDRVGNFDIWKSQKLPNGTWGLPEPVSGAINTAANEDQPYIHYTVFEDGSSQRTMRFSRDDTFGNMLSTFDEAPNTMHWKNAVPEYLGANLYHSEVSLSQDGNTAFFVTGDLENKVLRFMKSERQDDGSWGNAQLLIE